MDGFIDFTAKNGTPVRLRAASVADAPAMLELDAALMQAGDGVVRGIDQTRTLEEEQRRVDDLYRGYSAGEASTCILAEVFTPEPRLVAEADVKQFSPTLLSHVAFLGIGVHPEFQGQGLGRVLMQAIIDHSKSYGIERLELYVRSDNTRAQALYRAMGFSHEGTRKRFVKTADGSYVDDEIWVLFLDPILEQN